MFTNELRGDAFFKYLFKENIARVRFFFFFSFLALTEEGRKKNQPVKIQN